MEDSLADMDSSTPEQLPEAVAGLAWGGGGLCDGGGAYAGLLSLRGGLRSDPSRGAVHLDADTDVRVPALHAHGEEAVEVLAEMEVRSLPWRTNCSAEEGA